MTHKSKKSLGQNFLTDENILKKIVDAAKIEKNDVILEIGPGTGNLTKHLINKKPKEIIVIEKDKFLSHQLQLKYNKFIKIINDDILKFNINKLNNKNLKIIGNLPYNISSQILVKFIKQDLKVLPIKFLIFMFQKEVANRIIANENSTNYGRLSIISKLKFDIESLMNISPNCFKPKPKVKSTVLKFYPKKNQYNLENIEYLEKVTQEMFAKKRKKINNSLKVLFGNTDNIKRKLNLNLNLRPQNLNLDQFYKISKELEKIS